MAELKVRKRIDYDNPLDLEEKINEYFTECEANRRKDGSIPATKSGLLISLKLYKDKYLRFYRDKGGMWETLYDYAMCRVKQVYEEQLLIMRNPTGAIFGLKNLDSDAGEWKDIHTTETSKINVDADDAYKARMEKMRTDREIEKITRPDKMQGKALFNTRKEKPEDIKDTTESNDEHGNPAT